LKKSREGFALPNRSGHLCNIVKHLALILLIVLGPSVLANTGFNKPVKLTLWSHHRHMADSTKALIAEFNRTVGHEKGIKVNLRILGDDTLDVFREAQRNGEGPDLFSTVYMDGYSDPFKEDVVMLLDKCPGSRSGRSSGRVGIGSKGLQPTTVTSMPYQRWFTIPV
jgi:hypothetical protein